MGIAVWMQDRAMVQKLLALRCPGAAWYGNKVQDNAFDLTVRSGSLDLARTFLATGDVGDDLITVPNALGGTILQAAAENGHLELVNMLLALHAEVDFPKSSHSPLAGRTALHCASMCCWVECCKLLLEHRACVNALDSKGCTPYALAVREMPCVIGNQASDARWKTKELLLEANADPGHQARTPQPLAVADRMSPGVEGTL